ncbi:thioredoxin family protein [soil metagenome]
MLRIALLSLVLALSFQAEVQAQLSVGSAIPMADHAMTDLRGSTVTLQGTMGQRGLAVIFWSPACPWVQRSDSRVVELANRYRGSGINFILLNPNDPRLAASEGIVQMRQQADNANYISPYLVDSGAQVARAFGATRTPEIFLFNAQGNLVYRGAIDDSPSDVALVENNYFQDALDAVVAGGQPATTTSRAFGCSIRLGQ